MFENVDFESLVIPRDRGYVLTLEMGTVADIKATADKDCQAGDTRSTKLVQTHLVSEQSESKTHVDWSGSSVTVGDECIEMVKEAAKENELSIDVFNRFMVDSDNPVDAASWIERFDHNCYGVIKCIASSSTAWFIAGVDFSGAYFLETVATSKPKRRTELESEPSHMSVNGDLLAVGFENGDMGLYSTGTLAYVKFSSEGHKDCVTSILWIEDVLLSAAADGRMVLWNVTHLVPIATFALLGATKRPLLVSDAAVASESLFVITESGKTVRTQLAAIVRAAPMSNGSPDTILRLTEMEGFTGVTRGLISVCSDGMYVAASGGKDLKFYTSTQQKAFTVVSVGTEINALRWSTRGPYLFCLTLTELHLIEIRGKITKNRLCLPFGGNKLAVDAAGDILIGTVDGKIRHIRLSERLKSASN